jgi:hypothetical protein
MAEERSSEYYKRRAAEERVAAEQAADERAAQAHRALAGYYAKLAADYGP